MAEYKLLKILRLERKMRMMDVARHLGISYSRYILIEKGKTKIERNDALLLSRLYNRSEYDFRKRPYETCE